jgi:hypothetical protein
MGTKLTMSKPKRVAIMLELDWSYKHHARVFAGTQQYAQERGWHSIMDEYVAETLSLSRPRSIPYDGIIARATPKLVQCAAQLKVPLERVMDFEILHRRKGLLACFDFRKFLPMKTTKVRNTL